MDSSPSAGSQSFSSPVPGSSGALPPIGVDEEWGGFFQRSGGKKKPDHFYQKCVTLLHMQDLFEPSDLADLSFEMFKGELAKTDATAGMKTFLEQAVDQAVAERMKTEQEELQRAKLGDQYLPPTASSASASAAILMPVMSASAAAVPSVAASAPVLSGTSRPVKRSAAEESADEEDDVEPGETVAMLLVPGTEDTAAIMRRGGMEVGWTGRDGTRRVVKKFRETPMKRVVSQDLALPTLYLHFLDEEFFVREGEYNPALRASNDNSELQLALPEEMVPDRNSIHADWRSCFDTVKRFLKSQHEVMASPIDDKAGGFGPKKNYKTNLNTQRWYYSLRAARPKAAVNLDKPAFGIPGGAELYLFAENHISVNFMSRRDVEAFETCITELPSMGGVIAKFGVFLKVFFEGGFAYNEKRVISANSKGYLPKNVGIACMSPVRAFENQVGIATGYPYLVPSRFLPFIDTVPVTIRAITEMSTRHARYGLCFTRSIFVWEEETFAADAILNFCSIVPHGGFYYTPKTMRKHWKLGGLLYAFGEAREDLEQSVSMDGASGSEGPRAAGSASAAAAAAATADLRVCAICLENEAVLATVPCGHRSFCLDCGERHARGRPCPICRTMVTDSLRVY